MIHRGHFSILFAAIFALLLHAHPALAAGADRFSQMDSNRDGRISWEEFSAGTKGMGRHAFDAIDRDGNGHLDRAEWESFFAGHGMGAAPADKGLVPQNQPEPAASPSQQGLPLLTPPQSATPPATKGSSEPSRPSESTRSELPLLQAPAKSQAGPGSRSEAPTSLPVLEPPRER